MLEYKDPEMTVYKNELYDNICTWLIEQNAHHTLQEMIRTDPSKDTIELPQEDLNFWGTTKLKFTKLSQLQVMQVFCQEECVRNNMSIIYEYL